MMYRGKQKKSVLSCLHGGRIEEDGRSGGEGVVDEDGTIEGDGFSGE